MPFKASSLSGSGHVGGPRDANVPRACSCSAPHPRFSYSTVTRYRPHHGPGVVARLKGLLSAAWLVIGIITRIRIRALTAVVDSRFPARSRAALLLGDQRARGSRSVGHDQRARGVRGAQVDGHLSDCRDQREKPIMQASVQAAAEWKNWAYWQSWPEYGGPTGWHVAVQAKLSMESGPSARSASGRGRAATGRHPEPSSTQGTGSQSAQSVCRSARSPAR